MNEKLRHYIDDLFANAPSTVRAVELKEEMYQNLMDKYNDLINEGKSEESAYNIAVASIGDVDSLIGALSGEKTRRRREEQKTLARFSRQVRLHSTFSARCRSF